MSLLLPFSWLYGVIVWIRNRCYDRGICSIVRVGKPVIAVGNLTTGGTGKTPLTEYIVKYCLDKQRKVAIVSRGYKRESKGTVVVSDGKSLLVPAERSGDEPYQMANKFPGAIVIVDEARARGAQTAIQKHGADVIVLDDAFQHRSIYRDVDIVTIDSTKSLRHEPMLPAGKRREQISSLARADMIVISGQEGASSYNIGTTSLQMLKMKLIPQHLVRMSDKRIVGLEFVKGKSSVAVCGIGNPQSFRKSLSELGADVKEFLPFPDHHRFSVSDVERIRHAVERTNAEIIVTTEKDSVRLQSSSHQHLLPSDKTFALIVKAEIVEGKQTLDRKIDELLHSN